MCEAWIAEEAWTLPSGMCEFKRGYDDLRYDATTINASSPETCTYLLKCALTNGFERDCPCNGTVSCKDIMLLLCDDPQMIPYPNLGLIRPYIFFFYAAQDKYLDKTPTKIVLSGSIQCRGYRVEASFTKKIVYLDYNITFVRNGNKDLLFCANRFVTRNTSALIKFFPVNCWNDSNTFSGQSYYSANVCSESHMCISPYRINDGNADCLLAEDENRTTLVSSCIKLQQYRFQCSSTQLSCLLAPKLTDKVADCKNIFDVYVFGNGTLLRNILCNRRNDDGCRFLRTYIAESSMNKTIKFGDQYLSKKITHHAYCNSHWDSNPPVDEHSAFCKEWICSKGSFRCKSNQCIPVVWTCDGEWDCSDASDEQGIFVYEYIWDRNQAIRNLSQIIYSCVTRYKTQPFSDICNVSLEFPCLLANATNPTDVGRNRPCISLKLIGDGVDHCYGGLDERNTAYGCI
ncbi:unnamed protein product, partial [Rotaria sp. Silwood2]